MNIAHISRKPLSHLSAFLKQDGGTKTQRHALPDAIARRPKAVELVVSKLAAIASEYDDLLGPNLKRHWSPILDLLQTVGADLEEAALVTIKADLVLHVIEGRCGLELRFCVPLSEFPWRLAWLVHFPPEAKNDQRNFHVQIEQKGSRCNQLDRQMGRVVLAAAERG